MQMRCGEPRPGPPCRTLYIMLSTLFLTGLPVYCHALLYSNQLTGQLVGSYVLLCIFNELFYCGYVVRQILC